MYLLPKVASCTARALASASGTLEIMFIDAGRSEQFDHILGHVRRMHDALNACNDMWGQRMLFAVSHFDVEGT